MADRPERPARGGRKGRRKVCSFCVDKIDTIDYKDVALSLIHIYIRSKREEAAEKKEHTERD